MMDKLKGYKDFLGSTPRLLEAVKNTQNVRVRFAPSPTGALHIGGVRTALYNYLFAKKYGGKFILRIEDTDSSRFVSGAEQYIKDAFDWLGIKFDEGPDIGGSYGPYRQSERRSIYEKYARELVDKGLAYYAFDSADELDKARKEIQNFSYNYETRKEMKNSLTMDDEEVKKLLKTNPNYVIRIKYPDVPMDIAFDDIIRGKISINTSTLDDKVIWKKKDELPTYHLANVVDDHLMKITHVIRGEEWIPSTPLHIYLYDSFGWDAPEFAHLPLILGPSGKLSKRDGDKYGFPVYPLEWKDPKTDTVSSGYKSMGYVPSAVINILAFLGWNPGTEKEIYTLGELVRDFDISRVNKAGAKFNQNKAAWFNGQHIKDMDDDTLLSMFKQELERRGIHMGDAETEKILKANKGKINFIEDIFDVASYLFGRPTSFDPKAVKKWKSDSQDILDALVTRLEGVKKWVEKKIQEEFENYVRDNNIKFSDIAPQLRLVLTGKANGPSLFGIMEMIGKDESMDRIKNHQPIGEEQENSNVLTNEEEQRISSLEKELEKVSDVLSKTEKKLSNPNFVNKAPAQVVEKEKEKMTALTNRHNEIQAELSNLRG